MIESSKSFYLPVFWSRQHGAYISLITAWIIAVSITGFTAVQLVAILFLLSGLNTVELLSEAFFRKSSMPANKKFWLNVYLMAILVAGTILVFFSAGFFFIFSVLCAGSLFYLFLFRVKMHKKLLPEILVFLLISIAAFIGSSSESHKGIVSAAIVMTLFFSSSIFTVKERFGKIEKWHVFVYLLAASVLLLAISKNSVFAFLVIVLLITKTSGIWAYPERFHKTTIKQIGILEGIYQVVLIFLFLLFW